jgi:hypothetical protein
MPITRSDVAMFTTGVAVGAIAIATYPRWKDRVAPLIATGLAGVAAAYEDAKARAAEASGSSATFAHDSARNGAAAAAAHSA